MKRKYHCPRCKNEKIINYKDSIDCPRCQLEFEKKDFEFFDDEDILSVEEKLKISKIFIDANKD